MMEFLMRQHKKYLRNDLINGDVRPKAPKKEGKKAVVYCTFGGSHTGINEAVPTTKYLSQLPDHLGFTCSRGVAFRGRVPRKIQDSK